MKSLLLAYHICSEPETITQPKQKEYKSVIARQRVKMTPGYCNRPDYRKAAPIKYNLPNLPDFHKKNKKTKQIILEELRKRNKKTQERIEKNKRLEGIIDKMEVDKKE